jgi:hypothetical protein
MAKTREQAQEERDQTTSEKGYLASRTAIEAGEAYLEGDMPTAVALYKKAGDYLVECIPLQVKAGERDFVRVLAAANYFKGGHYILALRQIERVKSARLKKEFRPVCSKFKTALKERTHKDYSKNVGAKLKKMAAKRDYEGILELLNEHPFALPAEDTIRLRFHFANLAGLLTVDEIASQLGVDLPPESEEGKEAMEAANEARFALPPGMRRSVVTGELEPEPEGAQAQILASEYVSEEQSRESDVLRKTLFG